MSLLQNDAPRFISQTPGRLSRRSLIERALAFGLTCGVLSPLAACGDASNANGTVTLAIWDYYDTTPAITKRLTDFSATHPKVKFQRSYVPYNNLNTKVLQAAASGTLPDLIVFNGVDHSQYSSQGMLVDITDRLKAANLTDKYYPGPLQSGAWNSKNYGIPDDCNCLALYYNADMLDAAGVKPPATWDELRSTAKKLTKSGVYGFGMSALQQESAIFQFLPYLWQAGADINSLESSGATEALTLLVSMIKDGSMSKEVITWDQGAVFTEFLNGNIAMCEDGPWELPDAQSKANFKWGVVPMPKGVKEATTMGGETWGITTNSKSVDDAWAFLLSTQEPNTLKNYLSATGSLPTRKDIADDPIFKKGEAFNVFVQQMTIARPRTYGPNYPKMSIALQQALQSALTGSASPADALRNANKTIKPLL